jgi:hypothetical protein
VRALPKRLVPNEGHLKNQREAAARSGGFRTSQPNHDGYVVWPCLRLELHAVAAEACVSYPTPLGTLRAMPLITGERWSTLSTILAFVRSSTNSKVGWCQETLWEIFELKIHSDRLTYSSDHMEWARGKTANDSVLIIGDHIHTLLEMVPVRPDWGGAVCDAREKSRTTTVLAKL